MKHFYIILRVWVKVYHMNLKNLKEQTIFMLEIGDMFDVITLLDGKLHEVTIGILKDGEALKFPIEKTKKFQIYKKRDVFKFIFQGTIFAKRCKNR